MIPVYEKQEALTQLQRIIESPLNENNPELESTVRQIIEKVRTQGDRAIRELAAQFGDSLPDAFEVPQAEVEAALARVPKETHELLARAAENIRIFAQGVLENLRPVHLARGTFRVGLDWTPVNRVACYVPGGRYPLPSTALMTAVTAQASGVPELCIVSPSPSDIIIAAGVQAGVTQFYRVGGAQAVAAIAFGTESIRAADMLVGPGNAYVTEAKRQLQGVIGIDMLAGPSEVLLIADAKANPTWVALDMLAQAEHGPDSRAYMLTNDATFAQRVQDELSRITAQETALPEYLRTTTSWGAIFCLETLEQCAKFSNLLAPEHLELQVENPDTLKPHLKHYGALFMGYGTPVPYGDYMAGPNHTLPTGRTARFSGCLNPLTFLRPQSWIAAGLPAQSLASDTARFAELEGLTAHALSAQARFAPSLTV